jgi:cell division protein FtsI/penicillin-binding protein 2
MPILSGKSQEINAISGVDIKTYIDKSVQITLDNKLLDGIEKYGASAGTAIVMRPSDGAILAMSSYPSYEPNKYFDYGDSYFINPVVSSSFEPGSIFKILIMAAAIDAGAVDPDTKCDICSGPFHIDKYSIETWDNSYHPDSTMTDVIVHSDNVGMVFAGQKLGSDKLYDYLAKFGLGELSGIDLQGESTPILRDKNDWGMIDVATASFGQGIAVTPIQYIRAAAAIANDGVINSPKVVEKILGDGWDEDINNTKGSRTISKETADKVTAMMVAAAESGESKWTYLRGFNIAGKTGTAQIPIAGHYDEEKTIASFIGFAPADDPEFIMLVTLREPQTSQWASETAAPLWYDIAKDLFLHFGIQPEN